MALNYVFVGRGRGSSRALPLEVEEDLMLSLVMRLRGLVGRAVAKLTPDSVDRREALEKETEARQVLGASSGLRAWLVRLGNAALYDPPPAHCASFTLQAVEVVWQGVSSCTAEPRPKA